MEKDGASRLLSIHFKCVRNNFYFKGYVFIKFAVNVDGARCFCCDFYVSTSKVLSLLKSHNFTAFQFKESTYDFNFLYCFNRNEI